VLPHGGQRSISIHLLASPEIDTRRLARALIVIGSWAAGSGFTPAPHAGTNALGATAVVLAK